MQTGLGNEIWLILAERLSHYVNARLADQFELMIHLDETRALRPLDPDPGWDEGELPDTYPSGV